MVVLLEQVQAVVDPLPNMKKAIIIFQKNAELGKVKTRLAEGVGDQAALAIYTLLVDYTHEVLAGTEATKFLFYSNYIPEEDAEFGDDYKFELQSSGDLGKKMCEAFAHVFKNDYDQVLVIGTDCAELSVALIAEAFQSLTNHQVVLGPATDGGYYLLGMREFIPGVFDHIPWSTDQVAGLTKEYLLQNDISFKLLKTLSDVDHQEDWEKVKSKFLKTELTSSVEQK